MRQEEPREPRDPESAKDRRDATSEGGYLQFLGENRRSQHTKLGLEAAKPEVAALNLGEPER